MDDICACTFLVVEGGVEGGMKLFIEVPVMLSYSSKDGQFGPA